MIPVVDGYINLISLLRSHFTKQSLRDNPKQTCGPEQLIHGYIRIMVSAFHCPDRHNGPGTSSRFLANLIADAQQLLDILPVLSSAKHLTQVMDNCGSPAVIQLLENADVMMEWDPLNIWHQGFRVIGLTHNGTNRICDGYGISNPKGLSPKGQRLVRNLSESGFILDVAQLSDPSFDQVVRCFAGALIVSHSGLRRFCNIPRNLSDEQVRIIIERGGIIGVTFNSQLLSSDCKVGAQEIFRHLDWLVQQYGPDQVALSSGHHGSEDEDSGFSYDTQFKQVAALLHRYGYPPKAIAKILGRNWSEFYALHLDRHRFFNNLNH